MTHKPIAFLIKPLSILLLSIGLVSSAGLVQAGSKVHEFTLKNGLKVLVKEDHRAPVVVAQIWYKVGSSYEHGGITGVSHVLEHMMFKGTSHYGPNEFSQIIAENGGEENAFTSRDYTGYYELLEKSRLPIALELEADRMRFLTLDAKEFAKEVKVVMEERRLRTDDKPRSLAYEQLYATAFNANPYRIPPIGWMNDLENLTIDDLKDWYKRWYAPNNATLIVVGDVSPFRVKQLAKRYFKRLKAEPIETTKPQREAEQQGQRRMVVEAPAKLPYLLMGYKAPNLHTAEQGWEPYALEVLAGILDGGQSARFAKELIRGDEIAAGASASFNAETRLEDLFLLTATPNKNTTIEALELALLKQIQRIKDQPPSGEELKRIKTQTVAAEVFSQDSISAQASRIGRLESAGLGWQADAAYLEGIRAVTAEQVQAVARKYLIEKHLTVITLKPQALKPTTSPQAAPGAKP